MKELKDIITALEEISAEIEFLRTARGDMGYTIADSLETIALIMLQQQQEKEEGQ